MGEGRRERQGRQDYFERRFIYCHRWHPAALVILKPEMLTEPPKPLPSLGWFRPPLRRSIVPKTRCYPPNAF
jgi:hypothetical protein